jgi:hypothetical protein
MAESSATVLNYYCWTASMQAIPNYRHEWGANGMTSQPANQRKFTFFSFYRSAARSSDC